MKYYHHRGALFRFEEPVPEGGGYCEKLVSGVWVGFYAYPAALEEVPREIAVRLEMFGE